VERDLRRFLQENFPLAGDASKLAPGDSLLDAGVIDSTGVLELIDFLERRYEIRVADDELLPENLDSVGNILRFLRGKGVET
jgi:acyl carrier protein